MLRLRHSLSTAKAKAMAAKRLAEIGKEKEVRKFQDAQAKAAKRIAGTIPEKFDRRQKDARQ